MPKPIGDNSLLALPAMAQPVLAPRESVRRQFNECDLWNVEEKLNHVRWVLGGLNTNDLGDGSQSAVPKPPPGSDRSTPNTKPLPTQATPPRPSGAIGGAVWAMNMAATTLITCGVVLLAWSWLAARPDLPRTGWAMSMLGALAWLAGWCTSLTSRPPLRSGGRFS
ncbi:MAG: hypothetical protein ACREHD_28075 [Pirellulales bacterium]